MPTYEYVCEDCGYHFDDFHGINETKVINCPICQGETRRLISGGSGIIFKGSGFYETDYKRKSNSDNGKVSHSKQKTDPKNKNETKTDNKSESPTITTDKN